MLRRHRDDDDGIFRPLGFVDRRGMADDGDEIAFASGLHAQHARTVLVVMERHPVDEPGEDFRAAVRGCFQA